jgi:hypothetical protein
LKRAAYALAALLPLLCGCASGERDQKSEKTPPPLLAAQRGVVMPYARARSEISFKPMIPSAQIIAVAALPGLGHDDAPRTRGIAFEYARKGRAMLLSEWPRQNFHIGNVCRPAPFTDGALMWATRKTSLVMTLQTDGPADQSVLNDEARRLTVSAACS